MKYQHVIARIFDTPLMIVPAKARVIVSALAPALRVAADPLNDVPSYMPDRQARRWFDGRVRGEKRTDDSYAVTDQGIAVVSVEGILAHTSATASPPSGITCYGELESEMERAVRDATIRGIMMDMDTPGGEASESAFALAERIRAWRTVKPIWAVADEMACSAGYLLASAASQFFVPRGGYAGSIGIYALHLDQSGWDKKEGLTWSYIYAGEHKIDGNPHEPLKDPVRAEIQADVDQTYERFLEAVGAGRPKLGAEGARKTKAKVFRGADMVKLGLADRVLDFQGALALMTANLASQTTYMVPPPARVAALPASSAPVAAITEAEIIRNQAEAAAPQEETTMSDQSQGQAAPNNPAPTQAAAPAAAAPAAAPAPAVAAAAPAAAAAGNVVDLAAARTETQQQATEIAQLCQLAGMPNMTAEFLGKGFTVAQARQALVDKKAAQDAATVTGSGISAAAGTQASAGNILQACKDLAAQRSGKTA